MTPNDPFIGQLEGYLEEFEGSTPLPEGVRDAIRAELPSTHQRPAWWPVRRSTEMSTFAKFGLAAAAVVVVALLGYTYFGNGGIGGPGADDPTPEPTASPTSSEPPMPLPPSSTSLLAGTYRLSDPGLTARPLTFAVPEDWNTRESFVRKGESEEANAADVYFVTWLVTQVVDDSCGEDSEVTPTATADEIVQALLNQPGHHTTGPESVTLGGYPARRLDLTFNAEHCPGADAVALWSDSTGGGLMMRQDQEMSLYVVDIDGEPMVLIAMSSVDASAADVAELEAMVDSVEFEPAAP